MSQYKKKKNKNSSWKSRGLVQTSYSDFWLTDKTSPYTQFGSYYESREDSAAIYAKAIKLHKHQRAIANFVKIVTNKDIPVRFAGKNSYTDGDHITISGDIKDNNFDVSVGLALHEASHIILTDMTLWTNTIKDLKQVYPYITHAQTNLFKSLLNWIEDRRIDNIIFKNSPGYKAYYHKLYDYYWNCEEVNLGLMSNTCTNPRSLEHWLFNIVNSLSPAFNPNRMKGLRDVLNIIDIRNISRLKNTAEVIEVTRKAFECILAQPSFEVEDETHTPQNTDDNESNDKQPTNTDSTQNNADEEVLADEPGDPFIPTEELTYEQEQKVHSTFNEQKSLINGEVKKKELKSDLQESIEAFDTQGGRLLELDNAFIGLRKSSKRSNCPGYFVDLTKSPNFSQYLDILGKGITDAKFGGSDKWINWEYRMDVRNKLHKCNQNLSTLLPGLGKCNKDTMAAYNDGFALGGLVAKKLQTHGESRDRIDNRQQTGTLDKRRIACLGYGVDTVFQRINIQRNKPAHLHLCIDASGSMDGEKWEQTILLAIAIARGIKNKPQLSLSVSVRVNGEDILNVKNTVLREAPALVVLWDSRCGYSIQSLGGILMSMKFASSTPEGLCYEVLHKSGYLSQGVHNQDTYLINISDGEPSISSSITTSFKDQEFRISSNEKTIHISEDEIYTNVWWNKLKHTYNLLGLSYFVTTDVASASRYGTKQKFEYMYGKESKIIDPKDSIQIAQTINNMLLQSKQDVLV